MAALTPNRSYPYSVPTDPADVPAAMQALAEAVEADLQAVEGSVPTLVRPMARLRGTTPLTLPGVSSSLEFGFDSIDFNLGGALSPAHNPTSFTIVPQLPGFWFAVCHITYQTAGSSTLNEIGLQIRGGTFGAPAVLAHQSTHVQPPLSDSNRNHHVAAGLFCDGSTISFRPRVIINRASGTAAYTFLDRSLTIFRMTQS